MGKIIVRYWERKFSLGGESYPHISLETPNSYVSFYPDSPDSTEIKQLRAQNQSSAIYLGKFVEKKECLCSGEMYPISVEVCLLNTELMDKAFAMLKKENLNWQMWGTPYNSAFNSATLSLLLLKIGGIGNHFPENKFNSSFTGTANITRAIFNLEVPQDIGACYHFASVVHQDIHLKHVLALARAIEKPSLLGQIRGLCLCCICCCPYAMWFALRGICGYSRSAASWIGLTGYHFISSICREKREAAITQQAYGSDSENSGQHHIWINKIHHR